MSSPFDPLTFFDALEEYQTSGAQSPADKPLRLATVDPAFTGAGNPKLTFDGEATLTTKTFAYLGAPPAASARVAVAPVGSTYLILGVVNGSIAPRIQSVTSGTRPASPVTGDLIYETDTGYNRMWTGSVWQFLSGPEISARYRTVTNSSFPATTNTTLTWSTTTRVGDITGTTSKITFNRAGWYDVRAQLRFNPAASGERFLAIRLKNASDVEQDLYHQNQINAGAASVSVAGPLWVASAGYYIDAAVWTAQATTPEAGWFGYAFDAVFIRPAA